MQVNPPRVGGGVSFAPGQRRGDPDYGLLLPLFAQALAAQMVLSIIRVTTSYRAVELGLSEVWVGVISATYALLPIFLAVWVGRFVDRGNDARAAWIGAAIVALAAAGVWRLNDTASWLILFSALLGIGQLFLMVAFQMLCVRSSTEATRETVFGNYMVANALGQGLGPLVVGWLGGAARLPPTQLLFTVALVVAVLALAASLGLRPSRPAHATAARAEITPIPELLQMPGLLTLIVASVMIVVSQDLIVIYLPLVGAERGIDVAHIGLLLTVRAAASVISRLFYAQFFSLVGRVPLTVGTMAFAAAAYLIIALPVPIWLMYVAVSAAGFFLGLAGTVSISNVLGLVPAGARAVAVSLRITGNRIGQVTMPLAAGVIAVATGAGSIFLVVAACLAASSATVHVVRSGKS